MSFDAINYTYEPFEKALIFNYIFFDTISHPVLEGILSEIIN